MSETTGTGEASSAGVGQPRFGLVRLGVLITVALALSRYDYAVFHTLVEAFCMIIAASVFIVVFNTRRLLDNDYLLFVGLGFVAFVTLGVPHTLAFKGVHLLPGFDNDLPTQAFIAQRFMLAGSFLIAPAFLTRRLDLHKTLAGFAVVTAVLLLAMLLWRDFPHMFVEGSGLTPLKKALEVVLSAMFLASAGLLWRHRDSFDRPVLRLTVASLGCFIASEIAFMLYATPFGLSNLAGHLFQVAAFWFVYRAVLVTGLANPFGLLFRELASREASLAEANRKLTAVAEISDAAISTLDKQMLVGTLLERLVEVMKADAAVLMLAEGNALRAYDTVGIDRPDFLLPIGEGVAGAIAASGKPEFQSRDAGAPLHPWLLERGIRRVLGVPLFDGDRLLGVLHVDWRSAHERSEGEIELLELAAARLTLALRNALMYESERHIAHTLQESLLALPEHVDGLDFASAYHAAFQAARVGGDFYDIFELDDGLVGVLVGDVSGKGLDAAVLTSLVRNAIRAHATERGKSPCDVLRLTNVLVERATDPATFVTVFFGILDRIDGTFLYCNAGHTSSVIVHKDGSVDLLGANSPLAGAFPDSAFTTHETFLGPDDLLFLYTDGLIEARAEGRQYGEARLAALLSEHAGQTPEAAASAVVEDVRAFAGGSLSDDVAVLAMRRVPLAAEPPLERKLDLGAKGPAA